MSQNPDGGSFWSDATRAIPIVGPIVAGMIERGQNRRAIERQNEYNKPINQLARLREAGLPYAAMTDAISGNQSQAQPGNDTGIENGISNFINTTMQRKQIELIDAQIKATNAQTNKTNVDAQSIANHNQIDTLDPMVGEPVSYLARKARLDIVTKDAQRVIAENQAEIYRVDAAVKKELYEDGTLSNETRQRLKNMVKDWELKHQQWVTTEMRTKVEATLINELEKGGMSVGEAFIHAIMTGVMGGGQIITNTQKD